MGGKMMLTALFLVFGLLNALMAQAENPGMERAAVGQAKSLLDLLGQNCKLNFYFCIPSVVSSL